MSYKYRILVVDDEPSIRDISELQFKNKGYEVKTACDGVEALLELERFQPDIIISDLRMPRMSGFELLSIVRRRFPQIAVIAVSGDYEPSIVGRIADAFFQKGQYKTEDILLRIAELIEQSLIRSQLPFFPSREAG